MLMNEQEPSAITAAKFPAEEQIDRSAAGLQYQRYQMGLTARGAALGVGRRVAPHPSQQFSSPALSGAQFGGAGSARATIGGDSEPTEEL